MAYPPAALAGGRLHPPAVSDCLICSGVVALIDACTDIQIRNVLLLVFFSTIGLSAKFNALAATVNRW